MQYSRNECPFYLPEFCYIYFSLCIVAAAAVQLRRSTSASCPWCETVWPSARKKVSARNINLASYLPGVPGCEAHEGGRFFRCTQVDMVATDEIIRPGICYPRRTNCEYMCSLFFGSWDQNLVGIFVVVYFCMCSLRTRFFVDRETQSEFCVLFGAERHKLTRQTTTSCVALAPTIFYIKDVEFVFKYTPKVDSV